MLLEVQRIFRRQKGALMMVEPPGQPRVVGIFEVDDSVLIAVEQAVFEDLRSAVSHAGVEKLRIGMEGPPYETAEERG